MNVRFYSALFVVGAPGVGKTSMVRELFRLVERDTFGGGAVVPDLFLTEKPKWTVSLGAYAAAGHYTGGTFDGADTVPYNGVNEALGFLAKNLETWRPRVIVFDGDRFSHESALSTVGGLATVTVAHLQAGAEALAHRRALRGSKQNASWMKGRATKAAGFAKLARARGYAVLDTALDSDNMSPEALAQAVTTLLALSR